MFFHYSFDGGGGAGFILVTVSLINDCSISPG